MYVYVYVYVCGCIHVFLCVCVCLCTCIMQGSAQVIPSGGWDGILVLHRCVFYSQNNGLVALWWWEKSI